MLSWIVTLPVGMSHPGFWSLFRANLAGDVLNNLIPSAGIGGEFAKPYLLRMPMTACWSGVIANKTVEILSGVLFVAAGTFVAVDGLPLDSSTRTALLLLVAGWFRGAVAACVPSVAARSPGS